MSFVGGRMHFPADAQIEAELGSYLPGIPKMSNVGCKPGRLQSKRPPVYAGAVDLLQQKAGNGTAAINTQQAGLAAVKIESPDFISYKHVGILQASVFASYLESMLASKQSHAVIENPG